MDARETAADIVLIEQLNARSIHALDGLLPESAEAFAGCFIPDGRLVVMTADGAVLNEAKGRAAIVDLWHRIVDTEGARHWDLNAMIEVDGDVAQLRAYVAVVSIKDAPRTILRTAIHTDQLVRGPSGWLFTERSLVLDPASIF